MMPPGAPGGREQRTKPAFVVVEDAAALAQSLAERFVVCARRATAERGRFDVALAGGSTPKGSAGRTAPGRCRKLESSALFLR